MVIDTLVLGDFQTNSFCVRADEDSAECLIIDPGLNPEPLIRLLQNSELVPTAIFLTHGHVDHIGGVETVRQYWPDVQVAIHEADAGMLTDPASNLSVMAGVMVQTRPAEIILTDDDNEYQAAGLRFSLLRTPGHTPGGICLYSAAEETVFAGDTLFQGSIGRSDFPGGSHDTLIDAIKTQLLSLPASTRVYPGHGPATTVGEEKKHNPFL
ncbi:MAG: MBL fold metallo-hydrolase [Planctomycetota bacterium]|jgi:glyoxylase-like metal-dependent hydrolase (beta-lactamase superfamily II)